MKGLKERNTEKAAKLGDPRVLICVIYNRAKADLGQRSCPVLTTSHMAFKCPGPWSHSSARHTGRLPTGLAAPAK